MKSNNAVLQILFALSVIAVFGFFGSPTVTWQQGLVMLVMLWVGVVIERRRRKKAKPEKAGALPE